MSTLATIRGLAGLGADGTVGVTDIVEGMYRNIAAGSPPWGPAPEGPARGIAGLVHQCIRHTASTVGDAADQLLALAPASDAMADDGTPARDAWLAALNGVLGDHLHSRGNPLATPLQFRRDDVRLDPSRLAEQLPDASDTLVLFVHGLCMYHHQWARDGGRHADAVDGTPLHLLYNSGRPIADNGGALADALQTLVDAWPMPLRRIQLVGHSMGGLVLRSALAQAEHRTMGWRHHVTHLVCLGTPHLGAPLERAGHAFNSSAGLSPYTAPLGRLGWLRSAGITDLREGAVLPAPVDAPNRFAPGRHPVQRVPLPEGVRCSAVAATLGNTPGDRTDRLIGDGLVPLSSALGQALGRAQDDAPGLGFAPDNTLVVTATHHWQLLDAGPVRDFVARQLQH